MSLMPKEFLIEEVRNGFMVPTQIKQFWAAELEVLEEIDRVCKKHNIQYFADWGSLLGAVRHGGFVPWDDDLDIVMKREDYRRFVQVAKTELKDDFCVLTYNELDYMDWQFIGKVVNKERACFEADHMREFHNFPFIACVDLFVLDYVYKDEKREKTRRELCLFLLAAANEIAEKKLNGSRIVNILNEVDKRWGLRLRCIEDPIAMGRYLYSVIEEQFALVEEQDADYLCQQFPWGLKGTAKNYPKKYYEKSLSIPFEYTTIPVPIAFDEMLRERYGNYFKFDYSGGAHGYPCFEEQKETFFNSLGMVQTKYVYTEDEIRIRERFTNTEQTFKEIVAECLGGFSIPETLDNVVEYQQLAIDLGNMIESAMGEGHVTISYIEHYCECLFNIYDMAHNGEEISFEELEKSYDEMAGSIKKDILERKLIVMMPVSQNHWNKMSDLYDKYANEAATDVLVWPIDRFYKDYDGSLTDKIEEDYVFQDGVISIIANRSIERLMFLRPDNIVISDGCDQWNENISVDPAYYSDKLLACTDKLTYFCPYEMKDFTPNDERAYRNMDYYVCRPGVVRADEIVVGSDILCDTFVEKLTGFTGEKHRDYWKNSVAIMDKSIEKDLDESNCVSESKKILYCINLGTVIAKGNDALRKISNNLEVFSNNSGISIRVCFFPDMDDAFKNEYIVLYNQIQNVFKEHSIGIEDYNKIDIDGVDAYYGDGCPYVASILDERKNVMIQAYCQ